MATPATGAFSGTPGIHHRQRAAADGGHRGRAVRFGDLRDDADRVGEVGRRRQHRLQRPPGQLAVADLAPARATHAAHFADRIGREVVVQQEVRTEIAVQRVDDLLVLAGAQRGRRHSAWVSPRVNSAEPWVRGRMPVSTTIGRTVFLSRPSIRAPPEMMSPRRIELSSFLKAEPRLASPCSSSRQRRLDRLAGRRDGVGPLLLVADREGRAHLRLARRLHLAVERRVIRRGEVERLLGGFLGQIDDQVDHRLHLLVAELDRAQHLVLGKLVGFRFHHHHRVLGAGDDKVEPLLGIGPQHVHVVHRRVQHIVAMREADARRADRPHEGHARNGQRRRGGDHRHDIGVVDQVAAEHGRHHQHFMLEARHEQRPARPVDQARGQRLLFGRPRLALEEAARDLAGGIVFLLVMHGQREEVLPRLRRLGEGHVGHHAGLAQRGDDRPIGLPRNLPRFQRERLFAPLD